MNLIDGFSVGHWTDTTHATGCTVILCPPNTVASAEVRGGSPGSRELALLEVDKKMDRIDAVLLTGGSAYGLAAADGVMQWLASRSIGYKTPWAIVPIVPAAVIFDLNLGTPSVRPGPAEGAAACEAATTRIAAMGNVGVGTGATIGKWSGIEGRMKGGFGAAEWTNGSVRLQVLVAVNGVGDVLDESGSILAGARMNDGTFAAVRSPLRPFSPGRVLGATNTTLAILLTNAALTKGECFKLSQRMHDGMARCVVPVHTSFDGDATFALSNGTQEVDRDLLAEAAAVTTAEAIRAAIRHARPLHGVPAVSTPA